MNFIVKFLFLTVVMNSNINGEMNVNNYNDDVNDDVYDKVDSNSKF